MAGILSTPISTACSVHSDPGLLKRLPEKKRGTMKARLELVTNGKQAVISFTPENEVERKDLQVLASSRMSNFFFRGFQYMNPEAEFIVQESPSER